MKKILVLILVVTLILVLVACNNKNNTSSEIDVSTITLQSEVQSTVSTNTTTTESNITDVTTSNKDSSETKISSSSQQVSSDKPVENNKITESKSSAESLIENNTKKLKEDSFGSYTFAVIETDENSPIACPGDLRLYGLYISNQPLEASIFATIATKSDSNVDIKELNPNEYFVYENEIYIVILDGGFNPNDFKNNSSFDIDNVDIDLDNGKIILSLGDNSLILQYVYEDGQHKLIAQNSYVTDAGGIRVTEIPEGAVFIKN